MEEHHARRNGRIHGSVPPGRHRALLVETRLGAVLKGTPFIDLVFIVTEGEACGEQVARRLWRTERALQYTRPELAKAGIEDVDRAAGPIEPALRCEIYVATCEAASGLVYSKVSSFRVLPQERSGPRSWTLADLLRDGVPAMSSPDETDGRLV